MAAVVNAATEAITTGLASVGLTDAPKNGDDAAQELSAAEGRRLYIGNLAYSTTEDELKKFFDGFKVESVSIPTNPRTSRAVGYAFVDVATKEEAERAIADLSGKEVLERKVSVQVARRPGSGAPATGGNEENGNTNGERGEGRQRRGRGGSRGRGGRVSGRGGRRRGDTNRGGEEGTTTAAGEVAATPASADTTLTAAAAGTKLTSETPASTENKAPRENRAPKKRGPPENGVASTTKVMVANLPYELTEEKLKELFAAYNPESAKIALRPIPRFMVRKLQARNEPRKGRGFGFVTLPSEEMQQKAVSEMNGKMIQDREIAVKVAIDNPKVEGDENEEPTTAGENGVKEADAIPVLAS